MLSSASPKWQCDWVAIFVLCAALALGGATEQGYWSDTIVQLVSLALLLTIVIVATHSGRLSALGLPVLLASIAVAVPAAQLIPLPPGLWSVLAGRGPIYEGFVQAGIDPLWMPLSLSPEKTLRSCVALAPPLAIFLAAAFLGSGTRKWMTLTVLIFAGLSVILGIAQGVGGASSPLRFYEITNIKPVGFFANRNHYSAFLYSAASFLGAWSIWLIRNRAGRIPFFLVLCSVLYVFVIFAILSATSRAGIILMVLAGLGLLAMAWREIGRLGVPALVHFKDYSSFLAKPLLAAGAIAFLVAGSVWFFYSAQHEARFYIFRTAWTAANFYAPVGAGFGTFAAIYQGFEVPEHITSEYINRAHCDWLEIWLEGGVLSVAAGAAFSAWFFTASARAWRNANENVADFDQILARASTIVIALLALHSLVDYPLRTTAMACVFALACGNLIAYRSAEGARRLPRANLGTVVASSGPGAV